MRIIKKNNQLKVIHHQDESTFLNTSNKNSIRKHNSNRNKIDNKRNNKKSSICNKDNKIIESIWVKNRGNSEFEMLMREQETAILRTKSALMCRNKGRMSDNDLESAINMGLYIAFKKYDPTRGFSFATFFGKVAQNEINMSYREYKRFNGSYTTKSGYTRVNVSYDVDNEDIISAMNLLTSRVDDTDTICEAKDVLTLVNEFLSIDDRFTKIIPFVKYEYKTKDIAEEVGCSQPQVSKVKKKFIKLFYERYPELKEYIESL